MKLIGIVALFTASLAFVGAIQDVIRAPDAIDWLGLVLCAALFWFVLVKFTELY